MKLLLDIGNSSVNWASEKESIFLSHGSFIYDKNKTNYKFDRANNKI